MAIEHNLSISGRFEFEFWYTSQDEDYQNETQLEENLDETNGYRLFQIKSVKTKETATTAYFYVIGFTGFVLIAVFVVYVLYRVLK